MPSLSPDRDSRKESRQRTYLYNSENYQSREYRDIRGQSPERDRDSNRDRRVEYNKRRSRSPRGERLGARRRDSPEGLSPAPYHRSRRHHRRHSEGDRSASPSQPPKEPQHDSANEHGCSSNDNKMRERSPQEHRFHYAAALQPSSKRSHAPLPSQEAAYKHDPTSLAVVEPPLEVEKQKPNYALTGRLAVETNTVANTSIVLKYNEPPEARLPPASSQWRLYVFKGKDVLETLPLYERSCWLFGRERAVVDFPTEHPSCSKQHAVLQFRYTEKKNEWGEKKGLVKPYVIDLESANGTKVNGETIPERRYVEVRSADVITFGQSTREYVILMPPKGEKKP